MRRLIALAFLLAAPAGAAPVCDAAWHDSARNRDLPVRIRLPGGTGKVPVVLFSPGLGGSTTGGTLWGAAWATRGLAVVHLEHPGSDAAVYRTPGTPDERRARVRAAASGEQLQARVGDIGFILDELGRRTVEGGCDLTRIDLNRIGIAGHSMGAWTVQGVAGQRYYGAAPFLDRRIKAAIAFSPSTLTTAALPESFGGITIPFLSITGTLDGAIIRPANAPADLSAEAQRTGPFTGMTGPDKYLLVFKDGDHKVFSGNLRRVPTATDAHIQAVTAAATTAFWGMTLLGDKRDGAILRSGIAAQLAPGDRFTAK
ncbi:MAG: dienelactone hydrolase [Sandarakinorhabdus sp.]|nr:dienelactone hydrolase [Sandarakinorhabdus sp.]